MVEYVDEKNGYECGYNLLMMCVAEQSLKGFWNISLVSNDLGGLLLNHFKHG